MIDRTASERRSAMHTTILTGIRATLVGGLTVLAGLAPVHAQVAIAAKAGTLGAGAELTAGVARNLDVRVGFGAYTYSDRRVASDIEYDGEARLRTATALLDWHPWGGSFRLTAGALYDATKIEGTSVPSPSGTYDIGGVAVPAALVGTLHGRLDFDPVVPYVGLGWGNPLRSSRLGFFLDLGVVFPGSPSAKLTPDIPPGSPLQNPAARALLDAQLAREERDIEREVADYDEYPVLALGLSYRF
jgi:hypothetical protein